MVVFVLWLTHGMIAVIVISHASLYNQWRIVEATIKKSKGLLTQRGRRAGSITKELDGPTTVPLSDAAIEKATVAYTYFLTIPG